MNAGDLRHRVKLQAATVMRDASGSEITTWSDVRDIWAEVKPLTLASRSREFWAAQAQHAKLSHEIRTRHISGVTPRNRILWGTRVFDIKYAINVDERSAELVLLCEEAV